MRFKHFILASALGLLASMGCGKNYKVVKHPESVEYINETPEERKARLGDTPEVCAELVPGHNNVFEDRINMVFVGVNQDEESLVESAGNALVGTLEYKGLLDREPFASTMGSFNVWYVTETAQIDDDDYEEGWEHRGDEADDAVDELAAKCGLPNTVRIGLVNWDFRSNASYPNIVDLNLYDYDLCRLEEAKEELSPYSMHQCKYSAWMCDNLDITANGTVDFYDEFLLYSDDIPEVGWENLCSYFGDKEGCLKAFKEGNEKKIKSFTSTLKKHASIYHSFEFCSATSEITGGIDYDVDKALCNLFLDEVRFGKVMLDKGNEDALAHELGHVFGLRDEYVESSLEDDDDLYDKVVKHGHNCFAAETEEECVENAPWSVYLGMEKCYKGCCHVKEVGGMKVWKSQKSGTMRYHNHKSFGKWNETLLCLTIYSVTGYIEGICVERLDELWDVEE